MNKVSILLIDNPDANATKLDSALKEAGIDYTLYFAGSGKNGMDILMGDPYHDLIAPDTVKMKPRLVILSKELQDISAVEFLGIIRKYYSLRDRQFLLLSDSLTDEERLAYQKLGIIAYLQRPLDKEQLVKELKPLLNIWQMHFTFVPFIFRTKTRFAAFVKAKIISTGVGIKVATACLVSALITSSATIYIKNNSVHEDLTAGTSNMPKQTAEPVAAPESLPVPELPAPKKHVVRKKAVIKLSHKDIADSLPRLVENVSPKHEALRIKAIEVPDSIPD